MSGCSYSKRIAFIHIPKNAGTSIRHRLSRIGDWWDFDDLDKQFRTERDPALANHFPVYRIQQLLYETSSNLPFEEFFKFMVIRNPWERMVSLYVHRLRKLDAWYEGKPRNTEEEKAVARQGFKPWLLRTPHPGDRVLTRMAQAKWGHDLRGYYSIDRTLRFENLEEDWTDLCEELKIPFKTLPYKNVGTGESKTYRDFYDSESRKHVASYFEEDIERFGYMF